MRYLLLIYGNEKEAMKMSPTQQQEVMGGYMAFTNEVMAAKAMVAGDALHPTTAATSVRVRGGKTTTTDGPFAETKEQLGGFYMGNANDLDEAVKWAAKIPGAKGGTIEVRPVMEFPEPPKKK